MIALQRRAYCGALLVWVLLVVLVPTRIGIESSWSAIAKYLSLGVLLLGVLAGAWNWWSGPRHYDALLAMAWSVSLGLATAWLCLLVIGAFTMGLALSDPVVVGMLGAGVVAGLAYHSWSSLVGHQLARKLNGRLEPPAETPAGTGRVVTRGTNPFASPLFWFCLGLVSGLCLMIGFAAVANLFRGPVVGVEEFGGYRFARNQVPINTVTGLAIMASGWVAAASLRRPAVPRALLWGLVVGATALGILFACQF
jgi:hypothetical protein